MNTFEHNRRIIDAEEARRDEEFRRGEGID